MRVGAVRDELVAKLLELVPRGLGIGDDLLLVGLELGRGGLLRATASAVMVWLWGPPWWPGKTEKLMGSSRSYRVSLPVLGSVERTPLRKKIMAPRGPRSDLWVVVVTTSAYRKGEGMTPEATGAWRCGQISQQRGAIRN